MNPFQKELDIAELDYNKQLQTDVSAYISALDSKISIFDMFTNGIISYFCAPYIQNSNYLGCISSNNQESFTAYLGQSAQFKSIPDESFVEKVASHVSKQYSADIGIAIAGIQSFPDSHHRTDNKVYLGYLFYNQSCSKVIECSGSDKTKYEQIINGLFGYLKMLYKKYSNVKKETL